jgi:hypothetical protein
VRGPEAKAGAPFAKVHWQHSKLDSLLNLCRRLGKPIALSPEKQRYHDLGIGAERAYNELSGGPDSVLPKWVSRAIFMMVMASHTYVLERYIESNDPTGIMETLGYPVGAVDLIRSDPALVERAKTAGLAPDDQLKAHSAAGLILYAEARPDLAKKASFPRTAESSAARKELLEGYLAAAGAGQYAAAKGDQSLSAFPTTYTAPPYGATLSVYPALESGLYGTTQADYSFIMALQFPSIWAGFQFHQYDFRVFKVPGDQLSKAAEAVKGTGREESRWGLLKTRLARDESYHQADVRAYSNNLWSTLGAPGLTIDPIKINASLRILGTLVDTFIESAADRSWVARFSFPEEGLYVVRCVASYDPHGDIALRRPPSVAWLPLFARDAGLLAEQHLQAMAGLEADAKKRIGEIDRKLDDDKKLKNLSEAQRKELTQERERLVASTGGVEGALAYQRAEFAKATGAAASDRVTEIDRILGTRKARGFGKDTERLPATYVNDAGQIIDLLIEVKVTAKRSDDDADYAVNDATTPSGLSRTARGKRKEAITEALKSLFADSDYGRGRASVLVDGTLVAVDVPTVSAGKLFMEALSHTATILSIVAIAAAPFTAGESMVLLMPAMVIGAVPSAYNIVKRGLVDKTLHADLALAMDIVNVVGALVGLGAETRAGIQAVRLGTATGKVIVVTGLTTMGAGVLVMGAGVAQQLDAIEKMPVELREAEVIKVLSRAMLNAGIMVGGLLVAQARAKGKFGPRNFDEWLGGLDESSRQRIESSRSEVEPSRNIWKVWSEMDPLVRELLTQCGSGCVPDEPPSAAQQKQIKALAEGLSDRAQRTLKGLLHDNRVPGAREALLASLEQARNAAPKSTGGAKKLAAVETAILAKGTAADYILANFSEQKVNEAGVPDTGRWKRIRQLADDVGNRGKIALETLGKVLDNVRRTEGGNPEEMLQLLGKLSDLVGKADGVERLLGPGGLSGNYKYFKGSRWTLRFLEKAGLWDKVKAFEEPSAGYIERVTDVRLVDGTRLEMKSWESWESVAERGFTRQVMADYMASGGFARENVRWAFEGGSGMDTASSLIEKMNAALDKALAERWRGYDHPLAADWVKDIKARLPKMIQVGVP